MLIPGEPGCVSARRRQDTTLSAASSRRQRQAARQAILSALLLCKAMQRQFVHLTEDLEYASRVASSRQSDTILLVHARGAHLAGIRFYRGNYHVWLAL